MANLRVVPSGFSADEKVDWPGVGSGAALPAARIRAIVVSNDSRLANSPLSRTEQRYGSTANVQRLGNGAAQGKRRADSGAASWQ